MAHEDKTAGQVEKETVKDFEPKQYVSYYNPPEGRFYSDSWLRGWRDGLDMKKIVFLDTRQNVEEYQEGFSAAIQRKVEEGDISVNQARDALGLKSYEPAEPAYDAVKIPQHYNTGQIEVANFIADQELAYPADNIIKYVVRAGKKDPAKKLEDIEKAAAYLQMMHNLANGLPAVVRDPETKEVVWSLFRN